MPCYDRRIHAIDSFFEPFGVECTLFIVSFIGMCTSSLLCGYSDALIVISVCISIENAGLVAGTLRSG